VASARGKFEKKRDAYSLPRSYQKKTPDPRDLITLDYRKGLESRRGKKDRKRGGKNEKARLRREEANSSRWEREAITFPETLSRRPDGTEQCRHPQLKNRKEPTKKGPERILGEHPLVSNQEKKSEGRLKSWTRN